MQKETCVRRGISHGDGLTDDQSRFGSLFTYSELWRGLVQIRKIIHIVAEEQNMKFRNKIIRKISSRCWKK